MFRGFPTTPTDGEKLALRIYTRSDVWARPGPARLGQARLGLKGRGSARPRPARPGVARPVPALPDSARLSTARPGSARIAILNFSHLVRENVLAEFIVKTDVFAIGT